jgi:thiol-disulfide isomerase/thioredoxin
MNADSDLRPHRSQIDSPPVARSIKVAFAGVLALAVAALGAGKLYTRLVLDRQRAREGLELMPQSRAAPDVALTSADGKPINLSAYKGKVLLVNFYATWCGPCRQEVPSLNELAKEVAGEPIAILAIDAEEDWATIHKFFGPQLPAFQLALDATGTAVDAYEQRPKGAMFPETFFVDPSFHVVAKVEGPRDWTDPAMLRYIRDLADGSG